MEARLSLIRVVAVDKNDDPAGDRVTLEFVPVDAEPFTLELAAGDAISFVVPPKPKEPRALEREHAEHDRLAAAFVEIRELLNIGPGVDVMAALRDRLDP